MERYDGRPVAAELLICSFVCGVADAAMIVAQFLDSRNLVAFVPRSIWFWCVAVWLALGLCGLAVVSLAPRRFRHALAAAAIAGQLWLLIGIRIGRPLCATLQIPRTVVALVIVAAWLQSARLLRSHLRTLQWPARRRVAPLAGVAAFVTLALFLPWPDATEAAVPRSVERMAAHKPNIVVVFLDTLRFDTAQQMPNLHRFMERGTVFDGAVAAAPWTLPSHFAVLTGDSAAKNGITFDQQTYLTDDALPLQVRRAGYDSAGVSANIFLNDGSGFTRGFRRFDVVGQGLDLCRVAPVMMINRYSPAFQHNVCSAPAEGVIATAGDFIDERRGPLFLLLNFTDVHDLYYVPPECGRRARLSVSDEWMLGDTTGRSSDFGAARRQRIRGAYDDAAQCLDRSLATLFARIDRLPQPTVTIITSDHGEQFGEHGLYMHGNSLYPELLHVPLAVVGSGIPRGHVAAPVSLTDVHDLVLHIASEGAEPSRLADLMAGRPAPSDAPTAFLLDQRLTGSTHPVAAVFDGGFELIARRSDSFELYDVQNDPATTKDLGKDPRYADTVSRLRALLEQEQAAELIRKVRRQRVRQMRSLGYLQ